MHSVDFVDSVNSVNPVDSVNIVNTVNTVNSVDFVNFVDFARSPRTESPARRARKKMTGEFEVVNKIINLVGEQRVTLPVVRSRASSNFESYGQRAERFRSICCARELRPGRKAPFTLPSLRDNTFRVSATYPLRDS